MEAREKVREGGGEHAQRTTRSFGLAKAARSAAPTASSDGILLREGGREEDTFFLGE